MDWQRLKPNMVFTFMHGGMILDTEIERNEVGVAVSTYAIFSDVKDATEAALVLHCHYNLIKRKLRTKLNHQVKLYF